MRRLRFSPALLLALALGACDNDASGPSASVTVRIQDSPFSDARAVLVTFSEVSAHRSGEGDFAPIPFSPASSTRTCDLKKLESAQDVLAAGALSEGHYTQLRLKISEASIFFDNEASGTACGSTIAAPDGASAPLDIPSGEITLNREFDVNNEAAMTITLDFEGEQSIHQTGEGTFMLQPVISVVSVE